MFKGKRLAEDEKKDLITKRRVIVRDVVNSHWIKGHSKECFLVATDKTELMVYLALTVRLTGGVRNPDEYDLVSTKLHRMTKKEFTSEEQKHLDFSLYHYFRFTTDDYLLDDWGGGEDYFALPKEMDVGFDTNAYEKNLAYIAVKKWWDKSQSEKANRQFFDSPQQQAQSKIIEHYWDYLKYYDKYYGKSYGKKCKEENEHVSA